MKGQRRDRSSTWALKNMGHAKHEVWIWEENLYSVKKPSQIHVFPHHLRSNISSQTLCDALYTDRIAPVMWEDVIFLLELSSKFLILFPSGDSFNFKNQCLHAWWGSYFSTCLESLNYTKKTTFLHIVNIPSLSLLILVVTLNI